MNKIAVTLAVAVLAGACSEADEAPAHSAPSPVQLQVSDAVHGAASFSVSATVAARRRAEVSTRISAVVDSVPVEAGERVRAGQLLVALDAGDVAARVAAAEAARALARTSLARVERLAAQGAATPAELDRARAEAEAAESAVREARAQSAYTELRAPFDGIVTVRSNDPGDLAVPGRPLLTVVASGELEVLAELPAEMVGRVEPGMEVRIVAHGLPPRTARVARVVGALDEGARTFRVEVPLSSPAPGLVPGSFVRLEVDGAGAVGRWIPADAVVRRGQLTGVFTVESDTVRLRWVRLGRSAGSAVELLAGPVGPVVRAPLESVRDGAPVTGVERMPFAPAALASTSLSAVAGGGA